MARDGYGPEEAALKVRLGLKGCDASEARRGRALIGHERGDRRRRGESIQEEMAAVA